MWILRVLPSLSHVDQTQESRGVTAKYMLFEVQEILRRLWTHHISSHPENLDLALLFFKKYLISPPLIGFIILA